MLLKSKRVITAMTVCAMLILLAAIPAAGISEGNAEDEVITLYYIADAYKDSIQPPKGGLTSYQLPEVPENAYYYYRSAPYTGSYWGSSFTVSISDTGLVTPRSFATFDSNYEAYVRVYVYGDDYANAGRYYTFRVIDYSGMFLDQEVESTLNGYIADEIKDSMTELEKLKKVTEICARDFDYSVYYQSVKSYIHFGCGDCWASTNFIVAMCEKLGIHAVGRPAYKDAGAGSGHRNVLAEIDGKMYIAEAGYGGTKPRSYYVKETGDYTYSLTTRDGATTVELRQYDRCFIFPEEQTGTWVIPSEINGKTVTRIADMFHPSHDGVERIVFPNTITYIGSYAFQANRDLKSVSLPEGLVTIGEYAFSYCSKLVDVTLPTSLTAIPEKCFIGCGTLTIHVPYSVTEIADNAFDTDVTLVTPRYSHAYMYALKNGLNVVISGSKAEIALPNGLKSVEDQAFMGTGINGVTVPDGTRSIGKKAFASCKSLQWIVIPDSVTSIADDAFYGSSNVHIVANGASFAAKFAKANGLTLVTLD